MDKELKELMKTICSDCPYSVPQRDPCEHIHCRQREAFNKVKAAYENVKKDLAGRQKKIESLSIDFSGMKASRDYYIVKYEVECDLNHSLYAKYMSAVRENADLKLKLTANEAFKEDKQNED